MMKVLFLASYFPKPTNPIMGTWALEQAQALRRRGADIRVISLTPWIPKLPFLPAKARKLTDCPAQHTWDGLEVAYPRWAHYSGNTFKRLRSQLDSNPRPQLQLGWLTARRTLIQAAKTFSPDIIYTHHTFPNGYLAWRLQGLFGTPYVITEHTFDNITRCETYPSRARLFSQVAGNASAFVTVARRMEQDVHRLVPDVHALTIHNGTEPIAPALRATPRPPKLGDKLVVFSAAMFYERKGLPLLVDAFAPVARKYPQAVLRIAGDGDCRPAVEAAIAKQNLGERVQLLGKLPQSQIRQEMVWADVFALIGWNEPFATVFSEAMSAGTPIIWADDGGIADVAKDRVHGRQVVAKDLESATSAIDELLGDKELRSACSRNCLALSESYLNWDTNAQRMMDLFAQAVKARARA